MPSTRQSYDLDRLLARLVSLRSVSPEGAVSYDVRLVDVLSPLHSAISFASDIPSEVSRGFLRQAAFRPDPIPSSRRSFLHYLGTLESQYLRRPKSTYVLCTSLSLRDDTPLQRRSMSGAILTFSPAHPKHYCRPEERARYGWLCNAQYPREYLKLRVRVAARCEVSATARAIEVSDYFRAMWNLFLGYGRRRVSMGQPRPLNDVCYGPTHWLFDKNGNPATNGFWYEPKFVLACFPTDIRQKSTRLHKFEQSTRLALRRCAYGSDVIRGLRAYCLALDDWDMNACYLGLWQVLERLTGTAQESYEVTIRRASFLYRDHELYRTVFRHLRDSRNELVHGHINELRGEDIVCQLKHIVEDLLLFHLRNGGSFSSLGEAALFLDAPADRTALARRIELLKMGMKYRLT